MESCERINLALEEYYDVCGHYPNGVFMNPAFHEKLRVEMGIKSLPIYRGMRIYLGDLKRLDFMFGDMPGLFLDELKS